MKEEFLDECDPNGKLKECICNLELVNYQLADLLSVKARLAEAIKTMVGHDKEGSKTYRVDLFDVEVSTPYNYRIDKKKYEQFKKELTPENNPVRESVSYDLNKAKYRDVINNSGADVALCLSEFIEVSVGKCSVNVKARGDV